MIPAATAALPAINKKPPRTGVRDHSFPSGPISSFEDQHLGGRRQVAGRVRAGRAALDSTLFGCVHTIVVGLTVIKPTNDFCTYSTTCCPTQRAASPLMRSRLTRPACLPDEYGGTCLV